MPVDPLFEDSFDAMKRKLRLTNIETDSDAEAILDEGILKVRTRIYDRLGVSRVATLLETELTDDYSTTDGILRAKAAQVEVLYVRWYLLQDLPTFFRDSSGDTMEEWNRDALTRETPVSQRRLDALWNEIQDLLDDLDEGEPEPSIRVMTVDTASENVRYPLNRQVHLNTDDTECYD